MSVTTTVLELRTARASAADCVRAVIWTVLFHRLFGGIEPKTGEAADVTYPAVADVETEALVNDKAREASDLLRNANEATISIKLYERRVKKSAWFAKTQNICWEDWEFHLKIVDDSGNLRSVLFEIVTTVDSLKEHIPPITSTDVTPFPYEISIS